MTKETKNEIINNFRMLIDAKLASLRTAGRKVIENPNSSYFKERLEECKKSFSNIVLCLSVALGEDDKFSEMSTISYLGTLYDIELVEGTNFICIQ